MNEKKLPIAFDVCFTSDCRYSTRLAIIQASPYAESWLATHMDVIMNEQPNVILSDGLYESQQNIFDDILITEELNYWGTAEEDLISYIIDQIDNDSYVIVDLTRDEKGEIRPLLLYGYNRDDQYFYYAQMVKNEDGGHYEEWGIEFDTVIQLFSDIRNIYQNDAQAKALQKAMYYYPLGTVKLRENYNHDNAVLQAIVNKICHEYNGGTYNMTNCDMDETEVSNKTWYVGASCLLGIRDILKKIDPEDKETIKAKLPYAGRAAFVLYEHRKRLCRNMEWIMKELKWTDENAVKLIELYRDLSKNMEIIHNLCNKIAITYEQKALERVINMLTEQHKKEKGILREFMDNSMDYCVYTESYKYYTENKALQEKEILQN